MSENKPNVGGQAVLEGVMMRSPKCFAVAVRRKGGAIVIREQPWKAAWSNAVARVPLVRGGVVLFESMQNGYSALKFSADQMEQDLAEEAAAKRPVAAATAAAPATTADTAGGTSGAGTRLATLVALGFFIALPQLLAKLFGGGLGMQDFGFHALTGAFKLALVLGYLMLIRRVPDVRRVFQYHGAEHKAIATLEAGEPLTVEYARRHSTRHARCGTTFLIVVVMVSVLAYAAILPPILKLLGSTGALEQVAAIGLKILMLPLVAGFAYELQRLGARFSNNPLAKLFLTPGYWVQGITTIEPSDDQLEIALASLRVTLVREAEQKAGVSAVATEPKVETFESYGAFAQAYGGLAYRG
jgi:uncharacterized protein YqhQ